MNISSWLSDVYSLIYACETEICFLMCLISRWLGETRFFRSRELFKGLFNEELVFSHQ